MKTVSNFFGSGFPHSYRSAAMIVAMLLLGMPNYSVYAQRKGEPLEECDCPDGGGGDGGCSATATCFSWSGNPIGSVSCTGSSGCTSGFEWVKCNGNKYECN